MYGLRVIGLDMEGFIAERELLYSLKDDPARKRFVVRISAPYLLEQAAVNFPIHPGAAGCKIEFDGLPTSLVEEVHGVDSIQALALATDVDPYLRGLSKKYDLYWLSGDPYFED